MKYAFYIRHLALGFEQSVSGMRASAVNIEQERKTFTYDT
jgi:hypothetical protein